MTPTDTCHEIGRLKEHVLYLWDEVAKRVRQRDAWREQALALKAALGKIAFSRGTDAGSVNAKNYDTAAEALAEFAAWEASQKGRAE